MKPVYKEAITGLIIAAALMLVVMALPAEAGHRNTTPPPPPGPTTVVNNHAGYAPGVALAGASGSCVKDWKPGLQKCVFWGMLDLDDTGDDETVHAFGFGVTTRVDQFALHFNGGFENFGDDDQAIMFTGSLNWR